MALREADEDIGRTSPLVYSPQTMGERRDQATVNLSQTLGHHHVHNHRHQPDLPEQTQRPRRDPNQNPDPDSSRTQIGSGSNLKPLSPQAQATTSTTTAAAAAAAATAAAAPSVRYRECLKNHAASMGTHVLDGCGEFMPSGEEGTPEALRCAACDCHRNFHRKEVDGEGPQYVANCYFPHNPNKSTSRRDLSMAAAPQLPAPLQVQPPLQQHRYSYNFPTSPPLACSVPPIVMNFAAGNTTGAPAEYSSSEDLNMYQSPGGAQMSAQPAVMMTTKKRFRTKFTQEQKEKMLEFAEKLDWKIQKQDEQEVEQFCSEVGVKRQVFKVWMHNNKQAMKRKQM